MVLEEELRSLAEQVTKAKTAEDVVGPDDDERKHRVRDVSKALHPDRWSAKPPLRKQAERAFARLQELLANEHKVSAAKAGTFVVSTKKRTYNVDGLAFTGTVANLYHATYERDGKLKTGLLKLPRSVRDNDLILAEAQSLSKIWKTGRKRTAYFPRLEDSFKHRDRATRIDRQALVTRRLDGFVSLADVKAAYPEGLDARDLAWIWRRCLAATSLLAELDIVHGSLVPEHILIHPKEHGVQLCGMTTSVPAGQTLKVLGGGRRDMYPPEVYDKEPVDHTSDLFTLHRTMTYMLRDDAPRQFYAFVRGVCFDRRAVRPQDSRVLLGEYDELLGRLYGARKFRVFPPMPQVTS